MYKDFLKVIDWFEKLFKRFKVIGYFLVLIFVVFYFIENGFEKKRAIEVAEKLTGLNIQRNILIEKKSNLEKERLELIDSIYFIKEQRDSILELKEQEAWQSAKYKREKDKALQELKDYTPTQNYVFLDTEAYPFIGEKIYPFNSNQMEGMRGTYVENESNKEIMSTQESELDHCNKVLAMTESVESVVDEVDKSYKEEIATTEDIADINEEEAEIAMKEWKKERRKKNWQKIKKWVYGAGGFGLGFLLGGK